LKPDLFSQLSGCSSAIFPNSLKPENLKDARVHSTVRLNHQESVVLLFHPSVVPFSKPQTCAKVVPDHDDAIHLVHHHHVPIWHHVPCVPAQGYFWLALM